MFFVVLVDKQNKNEQQKPISGAIVTGGEDARNLSVSRKSRMLLKFVGRCEHLVAECDFVVNVIDDVRHRDDDDDDECCIVIEYVNSQLTEDQTSKLIIAHSLSC
jgi:hypothetical protein